MTLIVAHRYKGGVLMAGDKYSIYSDTILRGDECKVFSCARPFYNNNTTLLFGHSGEKRGLSLLRRAIFDLERFEDISTIVNQIARVYEENKYAVLERGQLQSPSDILIATPSGNLYLIDVGFGILNVSDDFICIGNGREYAMGALRYSQKYHKSLSVESRIKRAFESASFYIKGISSEYDTIEAKEKT